MVIKDIEKLGGKLNELLECNIFENTRKSKYVEGRSLLVYLLRDKLKMRWIHIAEYFKKNGKNFDHSTAIHLFKMYPVYRHHNKKLGEIEMYFKFKTDGIPVDKIDEIHYLENKCSKLEDENKNLIFKLSALKHKLKDPLFDIITGASPSEKKQIEERIILLKRSWDWKSVDKCEVIEAGDGISGATF
tara:strand:- start:2797 stop:3360 length:564 start_codon:yes stop_codon:yes gene_type:complete